MRSAGDTHVSTRVYWLVAAVLAVITAIEFGIVYLEGMKGLVLTALYLLSAAKFALVAGFFMHLKFDSKIFTWLFATGLFFALGIGLGVINVMKA